MTCLHLELEEAWQAEPEQFERRQCLRLRLRQHLHLQLHQFHFLLQGRLGRLSYSLRPQLQLLVSLSQLLQVEVRDRE